MTTIRKPLWAGACVAVLALTGCFGGDDTVEETNPQAVETEQLEQDVALPETDNQDDAEVAVDIAERAIGVSVWYAGLEFEFGDMTVTDLDEGSDGPRVQGIELTFDVDVHNRNDMAAEPRMPVVLQWDVPDTGNVIEVNASPDFRQTPAGASAAGSIVATIPAADLESWDEDTARLLVGATNRAHSQVPIGSSPELITRAPVDQPQIEGTTLQAGPVTFTVESAEVRWDLGGNQVEEGQPLFEMSFSMTNTGNNQACVPRGEGVSFSLVDANNFGHPDLRVVERCVRPGDTVANMTGFIVDGDWEGDYTLVLQDIEILGENYTGETSLTLVGGPA